MSRLLKNYRVVLFLSLALTLVPFVIFYPRSLYTILDPNRVAENGTLLLSVNHDVGRLGNKMFKYAALIGIAKRENRKAFVLPYTADVDLENLFNLSHVEHGKKYEINRWDTITETAYAYDDPVFRKLPKTHLQLLGYLQSWKYFKGSEDYLKHEFRLKDKIKAEANEVLQDIRKTYPEQDEVVFVGVHVRRRDELSTKVTCISPKSFFMKSFEILKTLLPENRLVFVVAGNDLDWCQENLAGENVTILKPASPSHHFAVLASCQHFVVSVGSFGWWAGWLTGGYVIYYKEFPLPDSYQANGFYYGDYYPPTWIPVGD